MKGIIGKFPSPVIPQKHIKQMKPPGYNTLAITTFICTAFFYG